MQASDLNAGATVKDGIYQSTGGHGFTAPSKNATTLHRIPKYTPSIRVVEQPKISEEQERAVLVPILTATATVRMSCSPRLLSTIYFKPTHGNLDRKGVELLDSLSKTIDGDQMVTVVGFTDQYGHPNYNKKLALRRASTVADYLMRHSIKTITQIGKGKARKTDVLISCQTISQEAKGYGF
jgi:outer membrane protein OmpA-like peptidoglycan-associated protein